MPIWAEARIGISLAPNRGDVSRNPGASNPQRFETEWQQGKAGLTSSYTRGGQPKAMYRGAEARPFIAVSHPKSQPRCAQRATFQAPWIEKIMAPPDIGLESTGRPTKQT